MTNIKRTIINKPLESELLFATIELASKVLNIEIEDIPEDWFLNEGDPIHDDFNDLHSFLVYNDYVSEYTLQQLEIDCTSDLIEFYYECIYQ